MNILNSKGISLSFENKILRRDIKDICFFLKSEMVVKVNARNAIISILF